MRARLKIIFLILICFFVSSCTCHAPELNKPKPLPPDVASIDFPTRLTPHSDAWSSLSFYVKLHLFDVAGYRGSCTGNVISVSEEKSGVLTAAHCVGGAIVGVLVERHDGELFSAESFVAHPDYPLITGNDIGLVVVKGDIGVKPIPIVLLQNVEPGEPVWLGGFGHSIDSKVVFGTGKLIVGAVNSEYIMTRHTGMIDDYYPCFGNSGGGLLKLRINKFRQYEVVGLIGVVSAGGLFCHSEGNRAFHIQVQRHLPFITKYIQPALTL